MTVKELIEELKKCNPDKKVYYWGYADTDVEVKKVTENPNVDWFGNEFSKKAVMLD